MGMNIRAFQFQGMRDRQEDAYVVMEKVPAEGGPLCAIGVFDGVGGSEAGDLASGVAAVIFQLSLFKLAFKQGMELPPPAQVEQALLQANEMVRTLRRLKKYSTIKPDRRPAAVGAVAVLFPPSQLVIAYAGDVAVFIERGDNLIPVTAAHTTTAEDQPDDDPGAVTRFLGQDDFRPQVLLGDLEAENGDVLWVMSDGAYVPLLESGRADDPEAFFKNADESLFWDNATAVGMGFVTSEVQKKTVNSTPPTMRIATLRV